MPLAVLGRKLGMGQVHNDNGTVIPVTIIEAGPCTVLQKKTAEREAYSALQLGFADKPARLARKPEFGHLKASQAAPKRFVREVRVSAEEAEAYEVGSQVGADIFAKGERVDVVGRSKGKGFQGVMKRHHFKGSATLSHGTHEFFRHPGSIGTNTTPGRLYKGKRMAGHMGSERVTARNLEIVDVRPEVNLVFVKGAVPGARNGFVILRKTRSK
jgi:large subunit ribosomal protein L3